MQKEKYNLSFTSGSLHLNESVMVAGMYFELKDWGKVKNTVIEKNLLKHRTSSSGKRVYREIQSRLMLLTEKQLLLLTEGSFDDKKQMLWLAICKKHRFIKEFTAEVILQKFYAMDYNISYDDYAIFYNRKADWHSELDAISDSTRKKLREVLFKMIREVEIIDNNGGIKPIYLSKYSFDVIKEDSVEWLEIFPVSGL